MKIVSCFSYLEEIKPLAQAGADELYCAVATLPHFGKPAALTGIGPLKTAVRAAHGLGMKLSLAVNGIAPEFTLKQEAGLLKRLAAADASGVDAFITASPSMFSLLSKLKPQLRAKLHLSSVQPCFNSLTAGFFIKLGVSRLILPNQLAPFEAREIIKLCRARKVETEIFDYRFFGCAYLNGRCHLHFPDHYTPNIAIRDGSMCRLNVKAEKLPALSCIETDPAWKPRLGPVMKRLSVRLGCGGAPRMANAASFFDFFSAGVNYLKYGTRQDASEIKIKKVRELRAMLDLVEKFSTTLPHKDARACFIEKMTGWDGNKF
ncbi:MAG TPA: hypothetical protein DCL44_04820 [Elusimicrobia bacterium]|nr:hypothetical protein [Elusimicrobiota bacterium]